MHPWPPPCSSAIHVAPRCLPPCPGRALPHFWASVDWYLQYAIVDPNTYLRTRPCRDPGAGNKWMVILQGQAWPGAEEGGAWQAPGAGEGGSVEGGAVGQGPAADTSWEGPEDDRGCGVWEGPAAGAVWGCADAVKPEEEMA